MATVRIYKVAELLGIPSQRVVELLRRDHGIEVKSASSTIEEVVARQFAERVSRQLEVTLPSGAMFADTPASRTKGKKVVAKGPEPAKPAAPALGPPRLVKAIKPPPPPETEAPPSGEPEAPPAEPSLEATATVTEPVPAAPPEPEEPARSIAPRPGRVVPSTLRLRVEGDQAGAPSMPPPVARPRAPAPPPRQVRPPVPAALPVGAKPPMDRPVVAARSTFPTPPLGGPRPLPSRPIRTPTPLRPGMPPPRPTTPYRPAGGARPPWRPPMHRRGGGRRTARPTAPPTPVAPPPVTRMITLAEGMTVKDLAERLEVRAKDVLKKLLDKRVMMTINTTLDTDTGTMIAREFGADVNIHTFEEEMLQIESESDLVRLEETVLRAPVVTVMGHVDHGKTTLLDAIRDTRVAEGEAGGITQHIGAYTVQIKNRRVVFLDTPGHEAFTLMRARGARVTDIVILVVAADDGVMPQTQEAIDHAQAARVPIIVAINKIDKPDANPERVKRELADRGLTPEEWGGQTVTVETSAKKKQNIELLLEMILLVSDLGELRANPKRSAAGTVLEARLDRGRGPVATVLVQDGTLSIGDNFIAGTVVGKVRALIDEEGHPVKRVDPSTPVEVLGLAGVPQPGDAFQALPDPAKARQIAVFRQAQAKQKTLGGMGGRLTLETLQQQIAEGGVKELPLIIKADVQGSAEVLAETLTKLSDERVKVRIIHRGVGGINESDVLLASASNAVVIGFNVRPDRNASSVAAHEQIEIRLHSVIYNVTDEVKNAMVGLLDPIVKEVQLGTAEVRQTFKVPKFGTAAGCLVTDGRITRAGDAQARLIRDNVVIHEGRIGSLRRFKDDVAEVKAGLECGIAFERYGDIKLGDVIEAFTVERVAATV